MSVTNGSGRKLLASRAMKLRMGTACVVLLAVGAWLRPQTAAPLSPPEERPAPLLEEQVQQRAAAPFRGVEDAVARLPVRGVGVRPGQSRDGISSDFRAPTSPASPAYGVAVSESYVVSHVAALSAGRPPVIVTGAGVDVETTVAAFDRATGLLLLATARPAGAIPIFSDSSARPGALVIAAARTASEDVAIPLFITTVTAERYGVGGIGEGPAPGLPIYNLDGALLAVSAGNGTAWRIRHALDRLLPRAATASLPSSIGVAVQILTGDLAEAFATTGLAIVDVAPGSPAAAAGLEPGDVIVGVGAVASDSSALATALAALPPEVPARLSLRRGRRESAVTVTPAFAHELAALARPSPAADGLPALSLFGADALAAADVPSDALAIMVNGRRAAAALTPRDARRGTGAALVLFEHRGQRFFARVGGTR